MQNFYVHELNPVFLNIGCISLYWYGVMYGVGFIFSIWFSLYRKKKFGYINWSNQEVEYLLCLNMLGILLGGRVGYIVFYQWDFFCQNLSEIFNFWKGGMSFHGGLVGVIISIIFFSYQKKRSFFQVSDFVVPAVPFGLGLGRLGNFINGELWGRVTIDVPWAVLFPKSIYQDILIAYKSPKWKILFEYYGGLPRHPSQLYEMFLEGIILFFIVNIFAYQQRPVGSVSGLFLIFYGVFRIIIEFFRQPDDHLNFFYDILTLGQILSFPMIVSGIIIIYLSYYNRRSLCL